MKKNVYIVSLLMVAMGMVSCGQKKAAEDDRPIVDVAEVKDINCGELTTFTGKTKASEEANLSFRVSGQILRVLVNEGDRVSKGQVVAEMDSRDYQVQLAATQAEYEQVKADAERVMALYAEGNTTASNNDKARYGLEQMSQKLANHRNQLDDTKLRSTMNGYVQTKLHEAGETVSAGMPVLSVFGGGSPEVEINMSASDFADLERFTNFYCKFDVTGDEKFPLSVAYTSREANSSQLYTVRLKFSDGMEGKKITPGMSTMVYAETDGEKASGVTNVRSSAVLKTEGGTVAFVYDEKSGTVKSRPVSVAAINRNGTVRIDKGLTAGEKVVVSGVNHISDGQKVRLLQKPSTSNVGGLL
ncbi:MAG: efflux RND transporter periplasmic adaptor subunit [Prevotellaceae bacterium]|nr:efflux RND transporter periplasmic adaptor subunit [Prevotellaceae bacterium]